MQIKLAFSLLLIIALLSQSCNSYHKYLNNSHNYKTDIPIHNSLDFKSAKVYFDEDPFPDKPFIRGGFVSVKGKTSIQKSAELSKLLGAKAAALGYDAVIDIQKNIQREETISLLDLFVAISGEEKSPSTANFSYLSGVGIKFKENINYLDQHLKQQKAFLVNQLESVPFYEKAYLPNGQFTEINYFADSAKDYYHKKIESHDLKMLIDDTQGWEVSLDGYGYTKYRRQKRFDDWVLKKLRFRYDKKRTLVKIEFMPTNDNNSVVSKYIKLIHNEAGRIISKQVFENEKLLLTEDFYYEGKQLFSAEIYEPGWKNQRIVIEYHYYDESDFPELRE